MLLISGPCQSLSEGQEMALTVSGLATGGHEQLSAASTSGPEEMRLEGKSPSFLLNTIATFHSIALRVWAVNHGPLRALSP